MAAHVMAGASAGSFLDKPLRRIVFAAGLLSASLQPGILRAETAPELELIGHKLVGTLWDATHNRRIDRQALMARIARADYVLLGEKHDNTVHHRHQAWVIRQLGRDAAGVGVAFEMIDTAQADQLGTPVREPLERLIDTLEASAAGWKYRVFYKPVFEAVIDAGYAMYPANLPRRRIRDIARGDAQAVPSAVDRILKAAPLAPQQSDDLKREIREAHCDMLGEAMLPSMVHVQRVRDAMMTHSLVANATAHEQMVLIAGAGHVRADRGVPHYLRREDTRARILTLAFIEVRADADELDAYTQRWDGEALPFDVVWFTPRAQRADPCEAMKARLHGSPSP